MPRKKSGNLPVDRWQQLTSRLRLDYPHIAKWVLDPQGFRELRVKARDDGTCICIAKGFGEDGSPTVCFGVGYDAILALMALDAAIQGDNWRFDKPWKPKED